MTLLRILRPRSDQKYTVDYLYIHKYIFCLHLKGKLLVYTVAFNIYTEALIETDYVVKNSLFFSYFS